MRPSQIVEALDAFYAEARNLDISTASAIQLLAAKAAGVAPAEIEKWTGALRLAAKARP